MCVCVRCGAEQAHRCVSNPPRIRYTAVISLARERPVGNMYDWERGQSHCAGANETGLRFV